MTTNWSEWEQRFGGLFRQRGEGLLEEIEEMTASKANDLQHSERVLTHLLEHYEGNGACPEDGEDPMLCWGCELRKAEEALRKINQVRNRIVGYQGVNWSRDIYPLVAALDAAGIKGMSYDDARAAAEAEIARMKTGDTAYRDWPEAKQ